MNYSGYLKDQNGNTYYPKTTQRITTGIEFETGRTVDGKKEYGKIINCGNLPASASKTIDTGLSNVTYLDWTGIVTASGGSSAYPYKMVNQKVSDGSIVVAIYDNKVKITTYTDSYTVYIGYVTIYYTKN